MRYVAMAALALLLAVSPAMAQPSFKARARQLATGMGTDEVEALLGEPDTTEMSTCGQRTKRTWQCFIWTYRPGPYATLIVLFQIVKTKTSPTWAVNGWSW